MRKIKKIISLMLIAAMLAGILISCGNTQKSPEGATDGNDNAAAADNTDTGTAGDEGKIDENRINPELPDTDFGGYTFTFLAHLYEGDDWVGTEPFELVAERQDGKEVQNGEPINDAVYKRNLKIKEKYNINIKMIAESDEKGAVDKAVKAGDSLYDAVLMFNNNIPGIVTGDLLTNVKNLPYINLDKPWWDPAVNAMSIANKNFLLGGDLLILDNEATNVLLFNKELMASTGMDLPYNLAKEGKWTMDRFIEYMRGASSDLNGDGKMDWKNDRWGFVAFNDTLHALFVGGGGALAAKNEDDLPYMDFTSPRNISVLEKVMDIMYNKEEVLNVQSDISVVADWTPAFYNSFPEGRALFQWARLRVVEKYRGMEAEFGILPMPKFDETQENYYSAVNPYTGVLLGVPKNADNLERISIILEALAAESKYTLQPAYYDIVLQRKYVRDDESSEMLDIIFNSRTYDIGSVYSFGSVFTDFIALCNQSNRNVTSFYEKKSGPMGRAIDKVVGIVESMD